MFKKSRNQDIVRDSLQILETIAKSEKNIFPQIIQCVKNKCTLGEISDVLRGVFGEYNQN